jgi:hypothetical protein
LDEKLPPKGGGVGPVKEPYAVGPAAARQQHRTAA